MNAASLIVSLVISGLCAFVPAYIASQRYNQRLAKIAFAVCLGTALIAGYIVAIPVAIVFTVIALRSSPANA